jgi:hypothetical protein
MPNITVSERTVRPDFGLGVKTAIIAAFVVAAWLTLLGALSSAGAASPLVYLSSLLEGPGVFKDVSFNAHWTVGFGLLISIFVILGLIFSAVWPRVRRKSRFLSVLGFWIAAYLVIFQVIGRVVRPDLAGHLNDFAMVTGFLIAAVFFIRQYRRA